MRSGLRLLLLGVVALAVVTLASCGTPVVRGSSDAIVTPATDNVFVPTDQNLSDCVGTMERPNCGSSKKGDGHMYISFGVLMGGMALIGWRVAVAVRRRDREVEARTPEHTF